MKSIKNVYNGLLDKDKIKNIIIEASKGKKRRNDVKHVLSKIDLYTDKVYEMLLENKFELAPTRNRDITENGKTRKLTISPFYPNRILDYIIVETLKPYIRKSMYYYCVGNVDGRGIVFGKNAVARHYKRYKYYLQLDIHHFYPETKSTVLYDFIKTKIKDYRFLNLCKTVVLSQEDMPIGSYYSQWFSNWLLQDIDHAVKEQMGIPFYIRYVDDMVLMGNNKKKLLNAMHKINGMLKTKGLALKKFARVQMVRDRPIDFLGFRFSDNGVKLRMRNFKKLNNKIRNIRKRKRISIHQAQIMLSYIGWLKHLKTGYKYYKNKIEPVCKKGKLRHIVSKYEVKHAS